VSKCAAAGKPLRCAIYTRKSTEEGLEQAFSSLDAQRESAAAYVLSQKHEGWTILPYVYDDGGISGATMNRPALQRLLADVRAGRIDVVVVYKVDRLTRALADFATIVAVFDAAGVSFVSVTQAFNTTTSMGRLTLNVLLSFAQFEREVTAERIRDKIAASKKKGMWMGGVVPIGYRAEARRLHPAPEEAATVRRIFERYLALGSVMRLKAELDQDGIRTPERRTRSGRASGGSAFSRGKLHAMLSNPIYVGRIRHRKVVHAGQHEGIIDAALWQAVQDQLAAGRRAKASGGAAAAPSPLAGRLFDPEGSKMRPSHARRKGRRYRTMSRPI
jgi:site-specific DNA recombinase